MVILLNVKVDHMCEMLVISTQVGRQLELKLRLRCCRRKREKSDGAAAASDGCSYYIYRSHRRSSGTEFSSWSLEKRSREKTHMTWFLSSWKTWWRHASTLSTLWTIFLSERLGYQMTFLKPLQTYTHESESRILTDSHVSSLSLF